MTSAEKTLRALLALATNLVHPSTSEITSIRVKTARTP